MSAEREQSMNVNKTKLPDPKGFTIVHCRLWNMVHGSNLNWNRCIFATYLQGVNLCKSIFSIQEKFKCLYLESPCSAFIQVAPTFSKSCLKVALALVNLLPSFLHIWQGFIFLWQQVDFRVRKTFLLNEFSRPPFWKLFAVRQQKTQSHKKGY